MEYYTMLYIQESTLKGYLAENFAFLQILDAYPKDEVKKTIGVLEVYNDKNLGNIELCNMRKNMQEN
jgi:hypothetical protein